MSKNEKCLKSSHSANFGGGGNFLSPRNEDLENFEKITTQSKVEDVVKNTSPLAGEVEFVNTNSGEGLIQALTTMRSSRRFAPQDDMNFEGNGKGTQKPLNGNGLIASSPYSPIALKTKTAFTLAEVLITLGIIGIVAALTLPAFISNVQGRIQAKRVENINQKLSKVTDKMAVQSGLIGYPDTMAFVQEMKKHMSIAKVCDNSHLSECWGTTEVDVGKDKPWEISKTKTAKTLKIGEPDNWADTVGIVTADGTPMILSYDKNCNFDPNNTGLQYNQSSGKSNSLACLSGVFDWNGGARPNKLGDDVITIGMASGLGNNCAFEVNGTCYTAPFTPTPLTFAECEAQKDDLGIKGCYFNSDYWAGAVKQCGGVSKMPTMAQLGELASQMYVGNPTIGAKEYKDNIQFDSNSSTAKALGLTPSFDLWSGEESSSNDAYRRRFSTTSSYYYGYYGYGRDDSGSQAVCLGE